MDFRINASGSAKHCKLRQVWLHRSCGDELETQGTWARGFIIRVTASSDNTATESDSCFTWGGREKWGEREKHLCLPNQVIYKSAVPCRTRGESKLQPTKTLLRRDKKASETWHMFSGEFFSSCFMRLFIIPLSMCKGFLLWKSSLSKVSGKQRRFTYLDIGMLRYSLQFCVRGHVLHTCLLDLHTVYKGCPDHNTDISGVVMHEVIIHQ